MKTTSHFISGRLARRMGIYVILASTFIAIFTSSLQLYTEYRRDVNEVNINLAQIELTQLPNIASRVWVLDIKELQITLNNLVSLPSIKYIAIYDDDDELLMTAGNDTDQNVITKEHQLIYEHHKKKHQIGLLVIKASLDEAYNHVIDQAIIIIISNTIKTFIVAILILFIFYRLVARHLSKIAEFAEQLDVDTLNKSFDFDRKKNPLGHQDELDTVRNALVTMQQRLGKATNSLSKMVNNLQTSESFLNEVVTESPVAIAVVDLDENVLQLNQKFIELFGYTLEDTPTTTDWWLKAYPDEDYRKDALATWEADIKKAEETRSETPPREYMINCKDRTVRIVEVRMKFSFGKQLITFMDITERKQEEDKLRDSELRFKAIYENAPVLIDAFDENGRCILWNKQCYKTFGWTIDEINKHEDTMALFYPDPAVRDEMMKSVTTNPSGEFREWHPLTKDGKTLITMWSNFRLPDGSVFGLGYDITERIQAEMELQQNEDILSSVIKGASLGYWDWNYQTGEQSVNEQWLEMLGLEWNDIKGDISDWQDRIHPDDQGMVENNFDEILKSGGLYSMEFRMRHKDGHWVWINGTGSVVEFDAETGEPLRISGTHTDISERKKAEEEHRLAAIAFETHEAITITDSDSNIIRVNKAFSEITGYSEEEVIGKNPRILSSGRHDAEFYQRMWAELINNGYWEGEVWNKRKNGDVFLEHISITAVVNENGVTTHYVAHFVDITERKQADDALRESEERYRSISMSSSIAMVVAVDQLDTIISWNPAAEKMFGYKEAEILNRPLTDIIPERYRTAHTQGFQRASKSDEYRIIDKTVELHGLKKNGEEFPLELSLSTWKQGGKKYFSGIINDITERKQAEEMSFLSEQRIRLHREQTPLGTIEWNTNFEFVDWNPAAEKIFGYTREEVLGRNITDTILLDSSTPEVDKIWSQLLSNTGGEHSINENNTKDGKIILCEWYNTPLVDENGKVIGITSTVEDITIKRQQENQLQQAQKMEAVGQLTGGIAHDFNNLLSIIGGNLRFLRQDVGKTSQDIDELFEDAMSATDDGTELTQRLLAFSRTRKSQTETRYVNDTIEKFVRFLSRTLGENIELVSVLPDENLFINVDSSQLQNALLNLCLNARDAMPKGGTITISAERYYHSDDEYSLSLPEGDYVKLSVTDTGSGISPKDLQHVFEPFFTTKEVGKGSGLGLSTVYSFIQQSNGACHIDSTPGQGTTILMVFPEVMGDEIIDKKPEDKETLSSHGSKVILVVEDERRVRKVTLRDLRKLGYKTLEAENADMARTMIESGEPIDLLFSDIIMPGEMDGHMLAKWTEEHYPQIKIVLTSGYSKAKKEVMEDEEHQFPLIRKPYSIEKLTEQIRATLAEEV